MSNDRHADLAGWNDRMYEKHPTPYEKGLAGVIQRARVRRVFQYANVSADDRVFELGCESGQLLIESPDAAKLVGGDISNAALTDARALFSGRQREADFVQLDAQEALPFQRGAFDVIICSEMLEHVDDPGRVIGNIAAICDDATRVVLTIPIEAPKVAIKKVLHRVGLMGLLFPGIELGQSEWHLQAFSKKMLLEMCTEHFILEAGGHVYGAHYVGLFRRKAIH